MKRYVTTILVAGCIGMSMTMNASAQLAPTGKPVTGLDILNWESAKLQAQLHPEPVAVPAPASGAVVVEPSKPVLVSPHTVAVDEVDATAIGGPIKFVATVRDASGTFTVNVGDQLYRLRVASISRTKGVQLVDSHGRIAMTIPRQSDAEHTSPQSRIAPPATDRQPVAIVYRPASGPISATTPGVSIPPAMLDSARPQGN